MDIKFTIFYWMFENKYQHYRHLQRLVDLSGAADADVFNS